MRVFWTPEALQDRIDIWDYISVDNPSAALKIDLIFSESASRLADHPQMGRTGKTTVTREWVVHASYRMVYEVSDESICSEAIQCSKPQGLLRSVAPRNDGKSQ